MQMRANRRTSISLSAGVVLLALGSGGCPGWWWGAVTHRSGHPDHPGPGAGGADEPAAGSGGPIDRDAGAIGARGEPTTPRAKQACPTLATGTVKLLNSELQLWVGARQPDQHGPLLIYWHGTGSNTAEASRLGPGVDEILASGGAVASIASTTSIGDDVGYGTWYTGDLDVADELVACAVEQLGIDTRRIYTAGCGAGGLQAGTQAYLRSSYIAAAAPSSGGRNLPVLLQDPSHVPAVITAHGDRESDIIIINLAESSLALANDIARIGGFAVDCDHGGGHCGGPPELRDAEWQFLKDHPFGYDPEPYAGGLPTDFPAYCKVITN
jgi:hypothetical protein